MNRPIPVFLLLLLGFEGCAESARENIVDPVNLTTIEIDAPQLADGAIEVGWRYLAEGDGVQSFRITREASGISTDVATVAAVVATTADWEAQSYRDSTLVGGVRVVYRVIAISPGGLETTSDGASILVEGTRILSVEADPSVVAIRVTWDDPPEGTTGFELQRSTEGADAEIVFSTDDVTARSFEDADIEGNTTYTYKVVTRLGAAEIQSAEIQQNIYGQGVVNPQNTWGWSPRREDPISGATQLIGHGSSPGGSRVVFLMVTNQQVEGISVGFAAGVSGGEVGRCLGVVISCPAAFPCRLAWIRTRRLIQRMRRLSGE
jgi:hypothetical protein